MKKYFNLLIISILLMPIMVFADQGIDWTSFIIWELFMSLAASIAVLRPMVENSEESNKKQMFWTLFFVRLFILAILYFFWPNILFFEIYAVAFGALIIKNASKKVSSVSSTVESAPITKDVIEFLSRKVKDGDEIIKDRIYSDWDIMLSSVNHYPETHKMDALQAFTEAFS